MDESLEILVPFREEKSGFEAEERRVFAAGPFGFLLSASIRHGQHGGH